MLLLGLVGWIITTESGLRFGFWSLKPFLPKGLSVSRIRGKLTQRVALHGLEFQSPSVLLNIEELQIDSKLLSFIRGHQTIFPFSLRNLSVESHDHAFQTIIVPKSSGELMMTRSFKEVGIEVHDTKGSSEFDTLKGHGGIKLINQEIIPLDTSIIFGDNELTIQKDSPTHLSWNIKVQRYDNSVIAQGKLNRDETHNTWSGIVEDLKVQSHLLGQWKLASPTQIVLSKQVLDIKTFEMVSGKERTHITLHWDDKNGLFTTLSTSTLALSHPRCSAKVSLDILVSKAPDQLPEIHANAEILPGKICLSASDGMPHALEKIGGELIVESTQSNGFHLQFLLKESESNHLQGQLRSKAFEDIDSFYQQPMHGNLQGSWRDLSPLYLIAPGISQIEGLINLDVSMEGNLKAPVITANGALENGSFFVAKQGIQVKALQLDIHSTANDILTLKGQGWLGPKPFTLSGTINPKEQFKSSIDFTGEGLSIYNTPDIQISASPNLTLTYLNSNLFIEGSVEIPNASIHIKDNPNSTSPSQDVVYVNQQESEPPLKVIPSLYVVLGDDVRFQGYGLTGRITGKLSIDQRSDGLLSGTGKLNIHDGKYRLRGSNTYIHQGYFLFPEGTLLSNPMLDIRISKSRFADRDQSDDYGIYVQGTLLHPVMQLYSSSEMDNNQVLSGLGLGSSNQENQGQQLAQSAFLLSSDANPLTQALEDNLGLEEINLESRDMSGVRSEGGTDTVIVIGKSLSKKTYLQFLQGVMEPTSTVRLKYFLSRRFTTSVETGTEGLGGDLTFTMEKD